MATEKQIKYPSRPATDKQMQFIESLAKRRGYRFASQAIKDALGKVPVGGLSRERASKVIEFLLAK